MSHRSRRIRRDLQHQVFYASRELERHGVASDVVDLHALIDVTLTYSENRQAHILPIIESKSLTLQVRKMEARMGRYRDANF